jgi:hypothetical protein
LLVGADIHDLPGHGTAHQSMNRQSFLNQNVSQAQIKIIFLAVRPESSAVNPVQPWSHEGNSLRHRILPKVGQFYIRKGQDVFSVNLHFVHQVTHRRQNGHLHTAFGIAQANDGNTVNRNLPRGESRFRDDGGALWPRIGCTQQEQNPQSQQCYFFQGEHCNPIFLSIRPFGTGKPASRPCYTNCR